MSKAVVNGRENVSTLAISIEVPDGMTYYFINLYDRYYVFAHMFKAETCTLSLSSYENLMSWPPNKACVTSKTFHDTG